MRNNGFPYTYTCIFRKCYKFKSKKIAWSLEKYSHRFESQISIIMWLSYSRMNSCYFTLGTDDDLFKVVKGQWSLTFLWQCYRIYFLLSSLIFFSQVVTAE